MINDDKKTKFLYVTTFTGQMLKIPLRDYIDQGYIIQQLLNEGININNLDHMTFSTVEPKPLAFSRSKLPSRFQVEAALDDPYPPFPVPPRADAWPSIWSNVLPRKYTSLISMKNDKIPFCMVRSDGARVNLWSFASDEYDVPADWTAIDQGNVGLLYAVAWKQKHKQTITEGMTYEQVYAIKYGMSTVTQYSLSASFGASGFGLSASLSASFGQSFEITEEETFTENISIDGVAGKKSVICMWQLVDLFYLVTKDANNNYNFITEYDLKLRKSNDHYDFHADPLFFGNSEKTSGGTNINTNLTHPTSKTQIDVTLFDNNTAK